MTALLLCALWAGAAPPPPPPPRLDELPAADDDNDAPEPEPAPADGPDLDEELSDRLVLVAGQTVIGMPVAFLLGPLGPFAPLAAGAAVVMFGDTVGTQRSAFLYGWLGACAGQFGLGVLPLVAGELAALVLFILIPTVFGGPVGTMSATAVALTVAAGVLFYGSFAAGMFGGAFGIGAGATLGYHLGAEDKLPGDESLELPGLFEPAHPPPERRHRRVREGQAPAPGRSVQAF